MQAQGAVCPFKKTDYRYALWREERRTLRARAQRRRFRVEMVPLPRTHGKPVVSVDTSKAKSNVDVVRLCLQDLGWREYPLGKRDGGHCDIYWNGVQFNDAADISTGKVNKFPGMIEVLRKVNLCRLLDTMQQMYPEDYTFHPLSWFLPQQYADFCDACRQMQEKKHTKSMFIVKPDEGSQGEGIYLIQDPRDYINNNRNHIVQQYIADPLLLEGLKFDFRVYVIVTSLDPLEVYVCREGLARFCTVPYQQPTNKNIHEAFMHLTNYSVNKRSAGYLHTERQDDGSKRTMTSVLKKLERKGYDTGAIIAQMDRLIVKTIIAILPELKVEHRATIALGKAGPQAFQIIGFDILLKSNGKPILLEVNANPSLRIDFEHELSPGISEYVHSPVDEEIKRPLVMDTLILVAPRHKTLLKRSASVDSQQTRPTVRRAATGSGDEEEQGPDEGVEEQEGEEQYETLGLPGHRGYGSLEQLYPRSYRARYERLRVLERAADIFLGCLGCRGALRMGATGFRTFTRKCRLTGGASGTSNAVMDIMFIDLQRRWEYVSPERTAGLCFQGFVEAFFMIAKKKFPGTSMLESVESTLSICEANIKEHPADSRSVLPRVPPPGKKLVSLGISSGRKSRPRGATTAGQVRRAYAPTGNKLRPLTTKNSADPKPEKGEEQ